jgi:hypothetical protein
MQSEIEEATVEVKAPPEKEVMTNAVRAALLEEGVRFEECPPRDEGDTFDFFMQYSCDNCNLSIALLVADGFVSFRVSDYIRFRAGNVDENALLRELNEMNREYRYAVFTLSKDERRGSIHVCSTLDAAESGLAATMILRRRDGLLNICDEEYPKLMRHILGCGHQRVDDPHSTFPMHQ